MALPKFIDCTMRKLHITRCSFIPQEMAVVFSAQILSERSLRSLSFFLPHKINFSRNSPEGNISWQLMNGG